MSYPNPPIYEDMAVPCPIRDPPIYEDMAVPCPYPESATTWGTWQCHVPTRICRVDPLINRYHDFKPRSVSVSAHLYSAPP